MRQKPPAPNFSLNSSNKQNHKDRGLLDLPQFDSLPATAGLDNTKAFRLSIQHALALLPIMLAKDRNFATHPTNPQRFSLR
jgi:hypothetical protein